jgi:hypothetical protein
MMDLGGDKFDILSVGLHFKAKFDFCTLATVFVLRQNGVCDFALDVCGKIQNAPNL